MMKKKGVFTMIKTVYYLLMVSLLCQVHGQQNLGCTTRCDKGQFCKEDDCLPCPDGQFMSLSYHMQLFCKKWYFNPGRNVAIIKNGSSTEDIVWGCQVGFEKKYTSVEDFECLEIKIDLSTENSSATIHMVTSTVLPNTTTMTPLPEKDNLNIILPAVLVSVIIILLAVLTMIILYCIQKKRRKQTVPDPELIVNLNEGNQLTLNNIFHKIVQVIGIQECKKLFWNIKDPSKQFDRKPTLNNGTDCYKELQKWHSFNPNVDHIKCLIEALSELEYNFPADIRDLNDFLASLEFHEKLNNEFKKFCLELCKLLGPLDIDSLLNNLQVKELYDSRLLESKDIKKAFQDCLSKWSYKYPYIPNEKKEWRPLTQIVTALSDSDRNDIIENLFEPFKKDIHLVMIGIEIRSGQQWTCE